MNASLLAGFGLQASLIVAVGPQNAFVLRQGLRREHVWPVVLLCTAADALLMISGVAGVSAAVQAHPAAVALVTWGGVAALALYGLRALRRATRRDALAPAGGAPLSRRAALAQGASFTFLNPHVYLDTVLLVGTQAVAQPAGGTPWFLGGAAAASAAWFGGLGLAAHALAPLLARPVAWRALDLATGLTLCAFAARLALWAG
ncbi:LysE/ArgO family amino acid transporter [Anaeromyxobacter sp. PSR-1]|uniref:LysE/ArgO family amino acid transporter n=1 Tax=Anaeromyxobacter sp. PSR-1 TaxID=1300915 RepID=UPI0005DAF673|nr:LysE family transporter [Anaeromyxobacter sp. PSR-1]GAO01836.1 putative amino-acid transporter [Anaeromyxobacter sp. PSR-1]